MRRLYDFSWINGNRRWEAEVGDGSRVNDGEGTQGAYGMPPAFGSSRFASDLRAWFRKRLAFVENRKQRLHILALHIRNSQSPMHWRLVTRTIASKEALLWLLSRLRIAH